MQVEVRDKRLRANSAGLGEGNIQSQAKTDMGTRYSIKLGANEYSNEKEEGDVNVGFGELVHSES